MGIAYRLDDAAGLTVTVFDGPVTGDEWQSTVRELFANPAWPPGRLNLTDLRTADFSPTTTADREEIFAINAQHASKLIGMKSAAVGGNYFEETQRFERGDRASGLRIIAFDALEPACVWLGVDAQEVASTITDVRRNLRESPTSSNSNATP